MVKPGEYFEGEERTNTIDERVISFDYISNIEMIKNGPPKNQTIAYKIDVRRFFCNRLIRPKRYTPWSWP